MDRTDYDLEGYNSARNPDTSADELAQLAERSSDMGILVLIAAHPNASGALLAALWTHPHVVHVRYEAETNPNTRDYAGYNDDVLDEDNLSRMETEIARHPKLPEDMMRQFAQQAKYGGMVATNPSATPEILEAMVHDEQHYAWTIKAIGVHPNASAVALDIAACRVLNDEVDLIKDHANMSALAKEIIAYRQGGETASPEAVEKMAAHGTVNVLNRILKRPDLPAPVLATIFSRLARNFFMLTHIAQHPNTSADTLEAIADKLVSWYLHLRFRVTNKNSAIGDYTATLYTALLNHANSTPEIRASLDRLGDGLPLFRMTQKEKMKLAADPATPDEMLSLLALDLSEDVLSTLARNPSISLKILEMLIPYRAIFIDNAIASNLNASGELLREIYRRQHTREMSYRNYAMIAAHPNTPQDILAELARRRNASVQNALARNPNFQRP